MPVIHFTLDGGLPRQVHLRVGQNLVSDFQEGLKRLNCNKDLENCKEDKIEVYLFGVGQANYREHSPLKPDDRLPKGSSTVNERFLFVHIPGEQDLAKPRRLATRGRSGPARSCSPGPRGPRLPGNRSRSVNRSGSPTARRTTTQEFRGGRKPKDHLRRTHTSIN